MPDIRWFFNGQSPERTDEDWYGDVIGLEERLLGGRMQRLASELPPRDPYRAR